MNFGPIDRIILFGGSRLMAALCRRMVKRDPVPILFTSPRHLNEPVEEDGTTLGQVVEQLGITYFSTDDINSEPKLMDSITPSTMGLALGAAWIFQKDLALRFCGKLLDFMGIALPRYRGGAHYTWQILHMNKQGCCNLQVVYGGVETFHSGEIIKRKEYLFPASVRIPQDYFDAAIPYELAFLSEFFDDVARGDDFEPQALQEGFSTYFPFLYAPKHGFIDWRWGTDEIERFICAFDKPYCGASTYVRKERVYLKNGHSEYEDGAFHPFQAGLIYRKTDNALYIATQDGTIIVRNVVDENGQSLLESIRLGQRFYTPQYKLEEALQFDAVYNADGIQVDKKNFPERST